jgi:hypothetical protein
LLLHLSCSSNRKCPGPIRDDELFSRGGCDRSPPVVRQPVDGAQNAPMQRWSHREVKLAEPCKSHVHAAGELDERRDTVADGKGDSSLFPAATFAGSMALLIAGEPTVSPSAAARPHPDLASVTLSSSRP